jgi:hypothetical protein
MRPSAGAGVVTVALLAMLTWLPLFYFLPFVIVGAVMGAIHRRFAGIEQSGTTGKSVRFAGIVSSPEIKNISLYRNSDLRY